MATTTPDNRRAAGYGALMLVCLLGLAWYNADGIAALFRTKTEAPREEKKVPDLAASLVLTRYECIWVSDPPGRDFRPVIRLDVRNVSSAAHDYHFKARFYDSRGRLVDEASETAEVPPSVERGPIQLISAKGFIATSELSTDALEAALSSEADRNHPSKWRAELLVREYGGEGEFISLKTSPVAFHAPRPGEARGDVSGDRPGPPGALKDGCAAYEPAVTVVQGILRRRTFPGPPNFEDVAKGDEPETGFYLELAKPLCVRGEQGEEAGYGPIEGVSLLQLILDDAGYARLREHLDQSVTITGSLSPGFNGHHHAPLLLQPK